MDSTLDRDSVWLPTGYELFEDAANSHRHSPVTFLTVADESTVPFTFGDGKRTTQAYRKL